ncbi:uncharacterized protein LOC110454883 isoform X1 [Mizuhopecten yessoensis]|uniref:SAM domain-containing protein n=1 Tax=Mizuhopecten yessoensis TaxID=6573 RepID=A0A210QEB8_MIZYE|nr:uncharacterized protein LOC110454883 isoform X1 [Mizuhopecten yessoensis]OWF47031.1 hypothetical protein KP79_PYT01358 [Mizuhopecten yessoensis]
MADSSQDHTPLTLKDLEFTYDKNTALTLAEFFYEYKTNLPQLVIITEGHDGTNSCENMCTDQVYRIHTFSEQFRVLAEEEKGGNGSRDECLSIPVQTESRFYAVQQSGQENDIKTLATILLENKEFPIKVREELSEARTLTLQGEYTQNYLVGNCIHDGVLFVQPVYTVLSSVMKCAVVTGIEGKSQDEFQKQLDMYADFISENHITFDRTAGSTDTFRFAKDEAPMLTADSSHRDSSYCTMIAPRTIHRAWYTDISNQPLAAGDQCSNKEYEPTTIDGPLVTAEIDDTNNSYVQLMGSTKSTRDVRDRHQHSRTSETTITSTQDSEQRNADSQGRKSVIQPPPLPPRVSLLGIARKQTQSEEKETEVQQQRSLFRRTATQQHLDLMTVRDIGDRLKQLGLKRYVPKFSKKNIDGKTLARLSDDHLNTEFKLKPSEVIRLRMFIDEGHIPE